MQSSKKCESIAAFNISVFVTQSNQSSVFHIEELGVQIIRSLLIEQLKYIRCLELYYIPILQFVLDLIASRSERLKTVGILQQNSEWNSIDKFSCKFNRIKKHFFIAIIRKHLF